MLHQEGIKTKTGKTKWAPEVVRAILSRQIDEICFSPALTNQEKDAALHEVTGALYDTEALINGVTQELAQPVCQP